ncbi:MAG: hypothetical protein BJ554DRAFT_5225, partial [Olpidium bornovanus]
MPDRRRLFRGRHPPSRRRRRRRAPAGGGLPPAHGEPVARGSRLLETGRAVPIRPPRRARLVPGPPRLHTARRARRPEPPPAQRPEGHRGLRDDGHHFEQRGPAGGGGIVTGGFLSPPPPFDIGALRTTLTNGRFDGIFFLISDIERPLSPPPPAPPRPPLSFSPGACAQNYHSLVSALYHSDLVKFSPRVPKQYVHDFWFKGNSLRLPSREYAVDPSAGLEVVVDGVVIPIDVANVVKVTPYGGSPGYVDIYWAGFSPGGAQGSGVGTILGETLFVGKVVFFDRVPRPNAPLGRIGFAEGKDCYGS